MYQIQVSSRRRASKVSALYVARLGLNDGAQLWISFKLFLDIFQTFFQNKHFFITHIRDLQKLLTPLHVELIWELENSPKNVQNMSCIKIFN